MKTFKEFLAEREKQNAPEVTIVQLPPETLLEHEAYKTIPKSTASYRKDPGNTNTKTQEHVHVYAKPKGKGDEMYAMNKDGSGHDGHSGKEIPKSHADYFRSKGYNVKENNILECIEIDDPGRFSFFVLIEAA
jgi:hypothetical protein